MDADDELDIAFRAARAEQADATAARIERTVRAKLFATIGQQMGRYETRGVLGHGGLGVVFRAYDRVLDRQVAIKVIGPENAGLGPHARARLLREARSLAGIVHPHVLEIFDVGEHGDDVYLVSELLEGETLALWSARPQTAADVLARFVAAGRGLAAVHAAGLVHRDFKPANVVLADDGRVKVIDFGLAKATPDTLASVHADASAHDLRGSDVVTEHGARVGTPRYMAPEQARGADVDARADVYAFCVALAEALRAPGVPRRVAPVLARGMRSDPQRRWPTMLALLGALERARRSTRPTRASTVAGVLAASTLAVVLGSGAFARDVADPTTQPVALARQLGALPASAALARSRALFHEGDLAGATVLAEQTFWTAARAGEESMAVLAAADAMWLRSTAGDGKAADTWYEHARAALVRAGDAPHAELRLAGLAAQVHERRGELASAQTHARRRLALAIELAGGDSIEAERARSQVGYVMARAGNRDGVALCERAVAGIERSVGVRHRWALAARLDLGGALQAVREQGRAIAVLDRALTAADTSDPRSLRMVAGAINNLAMSRFESGDDREAEVLLSRAIEQVSASMPSDRTLLLLHENRARVLTSLGRHAEASRSIARAMDLAVARGEADTASYASALEIAGMLELREHDADAALAHFRAALAIRIELRDAPRRHRTEVFVARALADLGRRRESKAIAEPAMRALAELGRPAFGDGHALLGDLARARHDRELAAGHYRAALAAWSEEPADREIVARTERALADLEHSVASQ